MANKLFEPVNIGTLTLKNRLVRLATFEGMASNGMVSNRLINFYKILAEGGVGLIITGHSNVQRSGMTGEFKKR
ncbi:MAG: oxidoreductase [Promethearchaeota archaeon]